MKIMKAIKPINTMVSLGVLGQFTILQPVLVKSAFE
jgi:hypothetical protein